MGPSFDAVQWLYGIDEGNSLVALEEPELHLVAPNHRLAAKGAINARDCFEPFPLVDDFP
jgi:hypothetical protein